MRMQAFATKTLDMMQVVPTQYFLLAETVTTAAPIQKTTSRMLSIMYAFKLFHLTNRAT